MPISPGRNHARAFLNLANRDSAVLDFAGSALQLAAQDSATARVLDRVELWVVEQLRLLGVKQSQALHDDKVLDLLAALRMVTLEFPPDPTVKITRRSLQHTAAFLDELEQEFTIELSTEVSRRTSDTTRENALAESRRAVTNLLEKVAALRGEGTNGSDLTGDSSDKRVVLQAAAQQNETGIAIIAIVVVVFLTACALVKVKREED
ncbi:hypothetical protein [Streptomyces sp. NPDC005374]|uniref:hypothetical protein n=1 Tax=Streptomyces sp. NPDC005374 TaxID=3364713 RepID=UPI0036967B28